MTKLFKKKWPAIKLLLEDGWHVRDVGPQVGVSTAMVYMYCKKNNFPLYKGRSLVLFIKEYEAKNSH